jgi:hypothetical protein
MYQLKKDICVTGTYLFSGTSTLDLDSTEVGIGRFFLAPKASGK